MTNADRLESMLRSSGLPPLDEVVRWFPETTETTNLCPCSSCFDLSQQLEEHIQRLSVDPRLRILALTGLARWMELVGDYHTGAEQIENRAWSRAINIARKDISIGPDDFIDALLFDRIRREASIIRGVAELRASELDHSSEGDA